MADNLLDKASILLTPTAYDNSRMLSVKPNENLYGTEEVTNGDFDGNASGWNLQVGWAYNGNKVYKSLNNSSYLLQTSALTIGKKYKVTFTISDYVSGEIGLNSVFWGTNNLYSTNGTYEVTAITTSANFYLYSNASFVGSIDNVSVVEDLSGDFNFERNSAATRVNAQGLVENVQIISSELVSNGNFSQIGTEEVLNGNFSQESSELITNGDFATDSDWIKVSGVTISDGKAIFNNVSAGSNGLYQSSVFSANKVYKVTLEVSNYQSGNITVWSGGSQSVYTNESFSGNGTKTWYISAGSTNTYLLISSFTADGTFDIDNVSVKEVGQNWDLDGEVTIGDDLAHFESNTNTYSYIRQDISSLASKTYKIQVEVKNYVSGAIQVGFSGSIVNINATTDGIYTAYTSPNSNNLLFEVSREFNGGNFNFDITNISVKEVGQDWTFGTGWSMGDGVAINNGTSGGSDSLVYTSGFPTVATKNYELSIVFDSYDITNSNAIIAMDSGAIPSSYNRVIARQGDQDNIVNGVYKLNFIASSSTIFKLYSRSGATTTISNISLKEITDDTNIPRINYEGFSYQDSLGSELITNGNFSNGLTNWTNNSSWWSIVNGEAYHPASTSMKPLSQSVSTEVGKEYKISVNVNIVSGTPQVFWDKVSGQEAQSLSQGLNEVIVTTFKTNSAIYFGRVPSTNTEFYIDNVSVKEYLGQEIVPDSGCGSWLLEPQSTNLITYSSDFSQSNWSNFQSAITSSQINTLTNNDDATLFYPLYSSTYASLYDPSNLSLGIYTFSVFAKASGKDFLCIDDTFGGKNWFNLGNGTLGTINSSYTGNIQDFGNGWYRCSVTNNSDATFNYKVVYAVTDADNSTTITQNGIDGILLFGSQTEQQSYATSYIPTNGAANTRLQDIADNSGNASLISSPEGVLYAEIAAFVNSGATRYLGLNDGSSSNRVVILYDGTLNRIRAIVSSGGTKYADLYYSVTDVTDFHKVAVKYKANDFALWIDGVERVTETSGSAPIGLNDLDFELSGSPFYGKTKALAVYKEALTNANLRSLTYPNPVATTFDLDFDTIAEQFTFTRGSEATFVNAQGLIESTASNDAPRIDYSTGAKAFLLEPQSTNLITYSEDFSQWTLGSNATLSYESDIVAPDGSLGVYRLTLPAQTSTFLLSNSFTGKNPLALSIYTKSAATNNGFNLFDGSVTSSLKTATSEWQRFDYIGSGGQFGIVNQGDSFITDIYIWGAQAENQSYATSYIPTSGASATRNQELCNNATPVINSEEGTLYAEISALANDGTFRQLTVSDGSGSNRVSIDFTSTDNQIRSFSSSGGSTAANMSASVSNATQFSKVAVKYKLNDYALWINGVEVATDTSAPTQIGLSELAFDNGAGGNDFFGNTKGLKYYPKALADVQLEDLTTI